MKGLKDHLNQLLSFFGKKYLHTSMLSIPYFLREKIPGCGKIDIEAIAFLSAMYDYRMRVPLIRSRFIKLIDVLVKDNIRLQELTDPVIAGQIIHKVLMETSYFHRFDPHGEALPWLLRIVYEEDLEEKIRDSDELDLRLNEVIWRKLYDYWNKGFIPEQAWKRLTEKKFLPKPNSQSPLKRLNLFLRWMVRDEYPDLGLWLSIDKKKLKVPLGSEMSRVVGRVFYNTDEIRVDRRHMYMLTSELAKLEPEDPAKYDFVLSRPQILGICLKKIEYSHCSVCPLKDFCKRSKGFYGEPSKSRYINPLYSRVKEYIENKRIRKPKEKHDLIVKKTIEYLTYREFLPRDTILYMDYVIDHGFRPDIFYVNNSILLGEIKINSENIQGPQQLRVYLDELSSQNIGREEKIGILSYGKIFEGDLDLIRENIELLRLDREFNKIYIINFHGNLKSEPEILDY
ncbi:MAG: hypothetical protein B6U89_03825 [Desulfurococcales archaeon ex4484_58]|nr:MAG: hypothetical protein B6U89_03825 [Desulfurococcales archaeon ex4484_58]